MDNTRRKKKVLIISISSLVAAMAVIGLIIFIVIANKTSINLNDYLTISYTGYDGVGEADYDINYKKLIEDYSEELDLDSESAKITFEFVLEECVSGELNKEEGLSNGDNISFKWSVNSKVFEEKYGCTLDYEDVAEKVSGLQEAVAYDPFENLHVSFNGMAPSGKVKMDTTDIEYYWLKYTATPSDGLKNGDMVKVTVEYDDDTEKYCLENGIKLVSTEKEYTVDGLSAYVTDLAEIPDEQLTKMKNQAEDTFKAYVAANWAEVESLKAMDFLGCYLLNAKGDVGYGQAENYLFLIYKIDVSNSQGNLSYYYYTRFDSLYISGDGDFVVDILNYRVPKGSATYYFDKWYQTGEVFTEGNYYYLGYRTLDAIYNACVTENIEKYTYKTNVNEQ